MTCTNIVRGQACGTVLASTGWCRRCSNIERATAWNLANKARRREIATGWDTRNRDYKLAYGKRWREANPGYVQRWKAERPGYDRLHPAAPELRTNAELRRRARKRGADATLTGAEWKRILAAYNYRCAYCGVDGPMQQEHMTPLVRGGGHTAENVVPACPTCNRRKGRMTAEEFRATHSSS